MKAVLLAGGLGTRISEETTVKPKPMIEIGYKPILWHIMKSYSTYGVNEFNDANFRESQLIRLKVLEKHMATNKMNNNLEWVF